MSSQSKRRLLRRLFFVNCGHDRLACRGEAGKPELFANMYKKFGWEGLGFWILSDLVFGNQGKGVW